MTTDVNQLTMSILKGSTRNENHYQQRMLFCSTEGGYEGGFQATDNIVRLSENLSLEDWSSFNMQLTTPDSTAGLTPFNQVSISPDAINFMPPAGRELSLAPGLENTLLPGGDLTSLLGSMSAMPGGMGLVVSFFQALFSLFTGALTASATELAKSYAVAAQATLEGSKTLVQ